jgi:hypothetical protein
VETIRTASDGSRQRSVAENVSSPRALSDQRNSEVIIKNI